LARALGRDSPLPEGSGYKSGPVLADGSSSCVLMERVIMSRQVTFDEARFKYISGMLDALELRSPDVATFDELKKQFNDDWTKSKDKSTSKEERERIADNIENLRLLRLR
jgi:hypothetical protein